MMNQQNTKRVILVIVSFSLTIGWCPFLQDHANAYNLPTEKASLGPIVAWNKTYGGTQDEEGWMVQQTTDKGYILIGYTASYGNGAADIWLVKTNANGLKEWSKTFGGTGNDLSRAVQQTIDGGYILGGQTNSYGAGGDDIWVIKTDAAGNLQWQNTFGDVNDDNCFAILQLPTGEYVLTGDWDLGGTSDLYIMKLDEEGNLLWQRFYSGDTPGFGHSLQMTSDGGFIVFGGTNTDGNLDMWLLKTDADGIMTWEKTYGEASSEIGTSVLQTADTGFLLGGWILTTDQHKLLWVIKTDSSGDMVWEKTIDAGESEQPSVDTLGIDQTLDGGYLFAGEKIISGDTDAWVIKTDDNGNVLWDIEIGGSSDEYSCGVQHINETCYVIVGTTSSFGAGAKDMWLIKLSVTNESLPPLSPTITGPTTGTVNHEYPYTSTTTDPDGDSVFYLIDWDDGTISDWLGPYNSGASCEATHTWTKKGTYTIKVKAKDIHDTESDWAILSVTLPCAYDLPLFHLLQKMIQRLSFAFPILWHLLEY